MNANDKSHVRTDPFTPNVATKLMDLINGQSFKWIPDMESGRYHHLQFLARAGSTISRSAFGNYLLGLTPLWKYQAIYRQGDAALANGVMW